jgi:DNA-binding IclR family transcriptional regulator
VTNLRYAGTMATERRPTEGDHTFLTNHARVLLCVADDCNVRMRDIAECVGITERTAYEILTELVEQGYLSRERAGRRNCYTVHPNRVREQGGELEGLVKLLEVLRGGRDRSDEVAA